jgi:hypothetical protein
MAIKIGKIQIIKKEQQEQIKYLKRMDKFSWKTIF